MKRLLLAMSALAIVFLFQACSPEAGSKAWCEQMKEKPKSDWSANEAATYATHCLL